MKFHETKLRGLLETYLDLNPDEGGFFAPATLAGAKAASVHRMHHA
jgi:hypothetical protein